MSEEIMLVFLHVKKGNVNIVRILMENNAITETITLKPNIENSGLAIAIKHGNLEIVKCLVEEFNVPFDGYSFMFAALSGNLEIMKYLKYKGCSWGGFSDYDGLLYKVTTMSMAAINGNLDNMKWLLENGCSLNRDAGTSRLHIINKLYENTL